MSLTSTLSCLLRSYHYYKNILQKTSITLYSITFVLGIIGNGLVIWIAGFRMKKTISAAWFLHLAIADFLCCASIPLHLADKVYFFQYSAYIDPYCVLNIILFNINMNTSILLLMTMSIDRCVSVMWPFWAKVHRTRRLVRITAGGIWGLSLLLTSLQFYSSGWCMQSQNYCDYVHIIKIVHLIRLLIMFVIPFLIILTSYVIIFLKLRKRKRPQRSQRPYRIITAVILCFFICWSPYYILPLTPLYGGSFIQIYTVHIINTNLAYLNSCMNPIIYVFMSQDFQHDFLRSIPARLERALGEQTHPVIERVVNKLAALMFKMYSS
ncbi:N-formyl peptide receptor 3-like [Leptodactylus fuscus]